jgi:hypothetical protein
MTKEYPLRMASSNYKGLTKVHCKTRNHANRLMLQAKDEAAASWGVPCSLLIVNGGAQFLTFLSIIMGVALRH